MGNNLTNYSTKDIQSKLGITSDGIYGNQTTNAVKNWQAQNGLTADGIFGQKSLAKWNALYGGGTAPQVGNTVDANQLGATQPFNIPPAQQGIDLNALTSSFDTQATTDQTASDKAKSTLDTGNTDYINLLKQAEGRSGAQTTAEQNAGKFQFEQKLKELQQQANQKNLEYQQAFNTIEDKKAPLGVLVGEQASLQRRQAIDIAIANSNIQATMGNIAYAQDIADRAVAAEFDPIEAKIKTQQEVLKINYDNFTSAQQKLADTKKTQLDLKLKQIEQQRADAQTITSIRLEAIKNSGASIPNSVLSQKTNTVDEALKLYAPYMATSQNDVIKLDNGNTVLINKVTGKIIKNYGGGTSTPVIPPLRTVNGSPVDGYSLVAGDDPYFIAQKYGLDMNGLKALNPNVSDWTKLPIGATLNVPADQTKQAQNSALQTILGSGKFTKENAARVVDAINNGQDPLTVIKNQARDLMGTEGVATLKLSKAKDAMQELDKDLKAYYAAGGKSGIFQGTAEKFANRIGTIKDPGLVILATNINTSIQKYRNAVSGTAYSEQEGRDIASVFPGITKGEVLNNTIISARLSSFDSDIDAAYRGVLGSSYDQLKSSSVKIDPLEAIKKVDAVNPGLIDTIHSAMPDASVEEIYQYLKQKGYVQ